MKTFNLSGKNRYLAYSLNNLTAKPTKPRKYARKQVFYDPYFSV